MRSLRDARQEYWRRFRIISRRHRPLPPRSGSNIDRPDALLGTDLDEVLEGPDRIPIIEPGRRPVVVLGPLTREERRKIRQDFYNESGFCCGNDPELDKEIGK